MQTFDKFGYPIEIGDTVIFAMGGRSSYELRTGLVIDIKSKQLVYIKGNKIPRYSDDVVNTKYLMPLDQVRNDNPELFL